MSRIITGLLVATIRMSTPLMLGSLGEVFVERTGVMNIAIEGIFLMGAWGGFVGAYLTGNIWVGFLFALVVGVLFGVVYGFFTIKLKQHQIVTGVAINILTLGLGLFLYQLLFGIPILPLTVEPLKDISIPFLSNIPVIGIVFFSQNIITYLSLALVVLGYWVLFRTPLGLIIRSTGENPAAVDVAGINVEHIRFFTLLGASALDGLAGAFYSIGFLGLFTNNIIGGRGWIAFAICFLGNWNPLGILIGSLIFGFAEGVSVVLLTSNFKLIPKEFLIAFPYILTIVATIVRRQFNVPAFLGKPYSKESA
jgi:general nucleoside transport system permease protein